MRVPIKWLREYVKFRATPAQLADKLTFSGLEIEAQETFGAGLDGVIVVEVKDIAPHPFASELVLCTVNDGTDDHQVVCGARNFSVGDKVPFAPAGTTLPNGTKVEKAVIRDRESAGMLCAEDELGLSEDHSGLLLLDRAVVPGTKLQDALGLPEDVLVIEVTPNRPDCLSMIGIAREVAALYGSKLKLPEVKLTESKEPVAKLAKVKVEDKIGCPRYTARVITGLTNAPSPAWMRMRLLQSGVRPINNIVDVTNYVMLETGQPLHAFDKSLLEEGSIIVRRAAPGETMATLDGVDRKITPQMLMICDAKKPVAIAGVMGGAGSEIWDNTRDVLLESACFKPTDIRKTSKMLGLSTESSYRFERGVDINRVEWAGRRATAMMAELGGGQIARGVIDAYPKKPKERVIKCRFDRVRRLYGVDVSASNIVKIFKSIELKPGKPTAAACSVRIPTFRPDLEIEADLIEEVARLHGLDKIQVRAPVGRLVMGSSDQSSLAVERVRSVLAGLGLSEAMNYSFLAPQLLDIFNPSDAPSRVMLPNPVSADHSVLRNTLVPQLVETLGRNMSHQVPEAAMFELGRVFVKDGSGKLSEHDSLAIGLMGPVGRHSLDRRRGYDAAEIFLWLKGILEALAANLGAPAPAFKTIPVPWAEDGCGATILLDGAEAGVAGIVKPQVRNQWRMQKPVAVLEVKVAPLLARVFAVSRIKNVPPYPSVIRDMAIIVDKSVRNEDVMRIIRSVAPSALTHAEIFDIFESEAMGVGKRSLAYSFTYRSSTGTLTDEEANKLHEAVKVSIAKELGAEVRER